MSNQLRITEVKVNGMIVWRDPGISLNNIIEKTEETLKTSDYKEAKDLLQRIMEKK